MRDIEVVFFADLKMTVQRRSQRSARSILRKSTARVRSHESAEAWNPEGELAGRDH
jgi:hypothetical protein